ncbi:amino acid permease [Haliangium ochraceum]|uniref:Amino acid permease-associated region n=1 Tax=Haliangium ochraceum (strain DSM 14365 / JCM 11303 / SMP-2) TaxID=502025 RepID=D0LRK8_HALO1|nr:amino acid permease [Haliangium ochraceum]ACY19000.1 amino acid permease-associated region [Haliangium ochraceum DSM 14365]
MAESPSGAAAEQPNQSAQVVGLPEPDRSAQARFGTFGGVFTPCVLTILGVIMFMRSGYVIGDSGLLRGLLILAIAKAITTLTTLSLSAIATNTEVRTGGVYYMISRTLGPDFGGAIGITLFVSQAVSIAFYVIGASEALFGLIAPEGTQMAADLAAWPAERLVSSGTILLLFFVTFKGADVALRAQYAILVLLLLSVLSFFIGGIMNFDTAAFSANLGINEVESKGFWIAFAIFFPAATGITAGANMSGDLKNPARSIPRGTLLAIGFTTLVYLVQLVLMAGFTDQSTLFAAPFQTLKDMSIFMPLVIAGVFAATLSSALGSFLGAPRILQAMGKDRLLRPLVYFGHGHGPADEPRRATVLSLLIAEAIVWAGDLDAVAQVISMFFLIAYGMINLSAFVEGRGGNPSFRPSFRLFGWPAALTGSIGCAVAMVKIDETYAIVSMFIAGAIYFSLRGRTQSSFGDAKRGYVFSRTRQHLLTLENMTPDPKNWRPAIVVLTENADREQNLVQCASWLESGRGLLSVLEISSEAEMPIDERLSVRHHHVARIRGILRDKQLTGFADSVVVPDANHSLDAVLQAYSIGSLRPNTVVVSVPPPAQTERRQRVAQMLATVAHFGHNVVLYKGGRSDSTPKRRRQIHVWWHGQRNGSLLALFAYLASQHSQWDKAEIRMLRVVHSDEEKQEAQASMGALMAAARLAVRIEVVMTDRPVSEVIVDESGAADLVLLGMRQSDVTDFETFVSERDPLLTRLPPTLLVLSNGEADLLA